MYRTWTFATAILETYHAGESRGSRTRSLRRGRRIRLSKYQLATRNRRQRLDDGFALACLDTGFEGFDGVARKDLDALLTHNGTGVVLGIDEMHRRTGLRFTAGKHRFEHAIPEHALPTEFRKQR